MDSGAVLRQGLGRFAARIAVAETTCDHWPRRRRLTEQRADRRITKPRCVAIGFCSRIQHHLLARAGPKHRPARAIRPPHSVGGGFAYGSTLPRPERTIYRD